MVQRQGIPLLTVFSLTLLTQAYAAVDFDRDVKPILASKCFQCHGPAMKLAKLDLASREGMLRGGERGPALIPGDSSKSPLYLRVAGLEKPAMPMGGKISPAEVDILKRWVEENAPWGNTPIKIVVDAKAAEAAEELVIPEAARKYWAFQLPKKMEVPSGKHPIDFFLNRELQAQKLVAAPKADRRILVRRAYLDLTGLPPTPVQVLEFLNDKSANAWPALIDRLLASPKYGERWGRHWLDVARYADSNGYEHDFDRPNAWRYRDYVISAFNKDTPYDRFLVEQIAGDEVEKPTDETRIATGFLRNYAKVGFREKDNPQFRYEYLDDMIATLGRGVLGMTVQCARCHNHKFDPIAQKDYYRLQAALFGYVEVDHPLVPEAEAANYQRQLKEVEDGLRPLKEQLGLLELPYREQLLPAKYKKFPANVQEAINTPEAKRTPGQVLLANQIIRTTSVSSSEIDRVMKPEDLVVKKQLTAAMRVVEQRRPKPIPVAMGITDGDYRFTPDGQGDEPAPGKSRQKADFAGSYLHEGPGRYKAPPSYFLHHGDANSRGSEMEPGFLKVATYNNPPVVIPPENGATSGRRLALAKWLGSRDNPLTARVMANRIWRHHFGAGIVPTLDNFGKNGELPTHPELLDWLAVEFMDQGWSVKQMHRLLMTSEAYQMSSEFASDANVAKDAGNRYLWRFRQQRLEAESVRDVVLETAGSLNPQMFGKAVFPHISAEILANGQKGIWEQTAGEDTAVEWRRSVYVYRKRGLPLPFFEVFDLPDQNISCTQRNSSTVPTQALMLMNDEFILRQAGKLAERIQASSTSKDEQVRMSYELALSRAPTDAERTLALVFLETQKLEAFTHVLLNLNEFMYIR